MKDQLHKFDLADIGSYKDAQEFQTLHPHVKILKIHQIEVLPL